MIEDVDAIVFGDDEFEEDKSSSLPRFNHARIVLIIAIIGWLLAIGEANWIYKHMDNPHSLISKQSVTKLCAMGKISTRWMACS